MRDVERLWPHDLQAVLDATVDRLRAAGTDLQSVEVKQAGGGLQRDALESVCAFANARGGLLILGLTDGDFTPVEISAAKLASDLASACSDGLEPAVRPVIDIASVQGRPVVVARVEPLEYQRRPCYIRSRGMESGSFLRTHDGDRRLNSYEVHVMVTGRGQPHDDDEPVEGAGLMHLDQQLTTALLNRMRSTRGGSVFAQAADEDILHMAGVFVEPSPDSAVTLAGMLALGRYPQQFFPNLGASFVVLPTSSGEPMADGTRFLDNRPLDGPIPVIVSAAVNAMRRNMRRRSVIVGAGREDIWEYPIEAVREIVANALMHRDYHSTAHGSQVRIRLYPDRFEVSSVGGLHGVNAGRTDVNELIGQGITSTRNSRLAKLLEDVAVPGTGRPVCENRGSGMRSAVAALRRAGMPPPRLLDTISGLTVLIESPGLEKPPSLEAEEQDTEPPAQTEHRTPHAHAKISRTAEHPTHQRADLPPPGHLPPREQQIIELLSDGPQSCAELSTAIGISRQATLKWLGRMAGRDLVRSTEPNRRSNRNRWELNPSQQPRQSTPGRKPI